MRATVGADGFTNAIQAAAHATSKRPVLPEHGLVKIAVKDGYVSATCTDGSLLVESSVPVENDDHVDGEVLVDPANLLAFVSKCHDNIELVWSGKKLELVGTAGKAKLSVEDADFFYIPEYDVMAGVVMDLSMDAWHVLCRATTSNTSVNTDHLITIGHGYASVLRHVNRCVFVKTGCDLICGIDTDLFKEALKAVKNGVVYVLENLIVVKSPFSTAIFPKTDPYDKDPAGYLNAPAKLSFTLDGEHLQALEIARDFNSNLSSTEITCTDGKMTIRPYQSSNEFDSKQFDVNVPDFDVLCQADFLIEAAAECGDTPLFEFIQEQQEKRVWEALRITGNGIINIFALMVLRRKDE
jgi:hypothetical protein